MAIKPCRECKKDVSTEAKACPNCGAQVRAKRSIIRWAGLIFGSLVTVTLCTAVLRSKDATSKPADPYGAAAVTQAQPAASQVAAKVEATPQEATATAPAFVLTEHERRVLKQLLVEDLTVFANGGKSVAGDINMRNGGARVVVTSNDLQRAYDANEVAADQSYLDKDIFVRGNVDSINRGLGDEHYVTLTGGTNMFIKPNAKMAEGYVPFLSNLKKGQKVALACTGRGKRMASAWLDKCLPAGAWAELAAEDTIAQIPSVVASGDRGLKAMTLMALALAAVAPSESSCWKTNKCFKELPKAKKMPGLSAQLAERFGMTEAEVEALLSKG